MLRSSAAGETVRRARGALAGLLVVVVPLAACAPPLVPGAPGAPRAWTYTPPVTNRALGEAQDVLERSGLRLADVRLEALSGARAGTVLGQDPPAGVRLRAGDGVTVRVAVPRVGEYVAPPAPAEPPAPSAASGASAAPATMAPLPGQAAEALLTQGRASLTDLRPAAAAEAARRALSEHPEQERGAVAALLLARALEETADQPGALAALAQAAALSGPAAPVADFAERRTAELHFAAGRAAEGWAALERASQAAQGGPAGPRADAAAAIAARYRAAGQPTHAAAYWEAALAACAEARRPEAECAEVAARLAQTYDALGRSDQAAAVRWRLVGEWPRSTPAAQAMDALGATWLPALQRGVIAFHAGRWTQAADALAWYLNHGAPEGREDEARYLRGVALARMGSGDAIAALDRMADRHPHSRWAADALWEAGGRLLAQGDRAGAAARFERLAVDYPTSAHRGEALSQLSALLPGLGNPTAGRRYLEAAAGAGREGFHTFRARAAVGRPTPAPTSLEGQDYITAQDRAEWETWVAARTGRSTQAVTARWGAVAASAAYRRAVALLDAGYEDAARVALRDVVSAYGEDAAVLAQVAVAAHERDAFAYSTLLGGRLLTAVAELGEPSLLAGPRLAQKLAYPLAYWDLVEPAARAKGIDPLLLLGLMMQESAFQPRAASWANARGLTQFIPDTARFVAAELRWPGWTWAEMDRPAVSVPFGAHYLASLVRDLGGVTHYAVAGYNGGPGNVARWARAGGAASAQDVAAFMAGIDYPETRGYVRAVTTNHELYKAIYYR
ncbi:MAG TPA: transglycosylase SLT domain-containing protein [Chloroflexota bacterium]|nr:transglycosylase SLT domain-containing protein [Chloroflexota bacterium]